MKHRDDLLYPNPLDLLIEFEDRVEREVNESIREIATGKWNRDIRDTERFNKIMSRITRR